MDTVVVQVKLTETPALVAQARHHAVTIDRPQVAGGTDAGAKARELFLMALGSCFLQNLKAAIEARKALVSNPQVTVVGTVGGTPKRYTDIMLQVTADFDDAALMQKLLLIAERGCLLSNTLRGEVHLTLNSKTLV